MSELNELVRATAFTSFLLLGFLEIGQEMYVFTFTQPPPPILKVAVRIRSITISMIWTLTVSVSHFNVICTRSLR